MAYNSAMSGISEMKVDSELAQRRHRANRDARVGALLVVANLFLQLLIGLASPLWSEGEGSDDEALVLRTPGLEWYILSAGNTCFTLAPGGMFLRRASRSRRWQRAGSLLLLIVGFELALLAGLCWWRPHQKLLDSREPLQIRLLTYGLSLTHWSELWCVAVILAEAFLWKKQSGLVERTETLGYVLFAGFAATMLWIAWTIVSPPNPADPDAMSFLLQLANELLNIFAIIGTVRLSLFAENLLRSEMEKAG